MGRFCAFYERAERVFPTVYRDADRVAGLRDFLDQHQATLNAYVAAAVGEQNASALQMIASLLDFPMWHALTSRGMAKGDVAGVLGALVLDVLKKKWRS